MLSSGSWHTRVPKSPRENLLFRRHVLKWASGDLSRQKAIMLACLPMANKVIVAWGNDGALDGRDRKVLAMLRCFGVRVHHLGLTKSGYPKHPLARGKHRIPGDTTPTEWP
mgnify:CR=1 FL=1